MPAVTYVSGRPAREAHASLIDSLKALDHARHCAVLWFAEIQKRRLFRELGYGSMRQYALEGLGFSSSRCGDFMRLAAKLETLPAVRESLEKGELGYTKAAEVIKVATPKTEARWIETAKTSSRRLLATQVKAARRKTDPNQGSLLDEQPRARVEAPMRVTIELTPEQYARYEQLMQRGVDRAEALLAGMDSSCPQPVARRRAMIHIHECPSCGNASVSTSRGEREISAAALEQAKCDAVYSVPGRRNKATVPPKVKEAVLRRARHRCQTPGCGNARYLEIHHIRPRAAGGSNNMENLEVLCGACHRRRHLMAPASPARRRSTPNCPM